MHGGELHRLGERGVQYSARGQVVVIAWQPSGATLSNEPLRLAGLDPSATHRDEDTGQVHHGVVLMARGLPVKFFHLDYMSALVRLAREGPGQSGAALSGFRRSEE